MKQRITILILLASLVTMLAGCGETFSVKKGEQVRFTVTAEGNPNTKTQYAGYESGTNYERIEWVAGNNIRIFSMNTDIIKAKWADDPNSHDYYDYTILQTEDSPITNEGRTSKAYVKKPAEGIGLVWVTDPYGATLYGVYPTATPQYDQNDATKIVAFQGMTIPANQSATPDMDHAYMISEPSTFSANGTDQHGQSVPAMEMKFYPFFNAFYIELKSESGDLKINSVTLSSTSTPLAGKYKYLFQTNNGIPTADNVTYTSSEVTNSVTADLTSLTDAARTASTTHAVAVTLLTLPPTSSTGLTNMTLTVNYNNGTEKSLALNKNGSPISFKPFYKTRLIGLELKDDWKIFFEVGVDEWELVDTTTLSI